MARGREEIVITRYGKPIARLAPLEAEKESGIFGSLSGTVKIHGDIVAPLDETWEADA